MAQITPQNVKELRDKTGAGMGDCKKALVEADGNMEEAIEILRKKGAASAAKRADRSANDGLIVAKTTDDGKKGVIVEVNCETDFVARNEGFEKYVHTAAQALLESDVDKIDDLMKVQVGKDTIEQLHNEILAKFSEKVEVRRFDRIKTDGYVSEYIHTGSRLAVLLEVSANELTDNAKELVHDIAMQVAAMNPLYIDSDNVPDDVKEKEKEIYIQNAKDEGKNEEIAQKIAEGRLNKYYQENCLVDQIFVKDSKKTVNDVLKEISKEIGSDIKVKKFLRFYLGEEI